MARKNLARSALSDFRFARLIPAGRAKRLCSRGLSPVYRFIRFFVRVSRIGINETRYGARAAGQVATCLYRADRLVPRHFAPGRLEKINDTPPTLSGVLSHPINILPVRSRARARASHPLDGDPLVSRARPSTPFIDGSVTRTRTTRSTSFLAERESESRKGT